MLCYLRSLHTYTFAIHPRCIRFFLLRSDRKENPLHQLTTLGGMEEQAIKKGEVKVGQKLANRGLHVHLELKTRSPNTSSSDPSCVLSPDSAPRISKSKHRTLEAPFVSAPSRHAYTELIRPKRANPSLFSSQDRGTGPARARRRTGRKSPDQESQCKAGRRDGTDLRGAEKSRGTTGRAREERVERGATRLGVGQVVQVTEFLRRGPCRQ